MTTTTMLTVAEAAKLAGVRVQRMRILLKEGRIAGRQTGQGVWLAEEDSVIAWRDNPASHKSGPKGRTTDRVDT